MINASSAINITNKCKVFTMCPSQTTQNMSFMFRQINTNRSALPDIMNRNSGFIIEIKPKFAKNLNRMLTKPILTL